MKQELSQKVRVLFFAWGDSIHARRRIGIFCEDSAFEVGVISTFRYDFANAKNYYLSAADLKLKGQRIRRLLFDPILAIRYARRFKPDVIFLQTLIYPNYLSFLLPRKVPMMVTFWNGDVTWWAQWTGIERAFKKQIVLYGTRRAAAITVNSKAAFEACLGYGAAKERVNLIRYPGVNLDTFRPSGDKSGVRERLGVRHGKVVLCPRGLGGYLNSDIIIEAAAMVVERMPEVLFLFISGVDSEALKQEHLKRAEELGIVSHIRMDGQVPWDSMPSYYQAADAMVSISSNDSLPNCMLEAMACGIPVVMGDIPQIREWVEDGINGFLVPPRDPVSLAERLIATIADSDRIVEKFVGRNIEMVKREVDSKVMSSRIKELVRKVAMRTAHTGDGVEHG
ncbi:MAG: glycosyltransferase family 4 protein [Betaproteobacteria bacterium]|nr:glycosyltransferase family 4 protein [Betaproteobacteria bacterium]